MSDNDVLLRQLRECLDDSLAQRAADEIEGLQRQRDNLEASIASGHPESWARITKRLTDERDRLHRCAAFFRCCALSGEIPTITIEEFEVDNGSNCGLHCD